jgi:hypothetical protein
MNREQTTSTRMQLIATKHCHPERRICFREAKANPKSRDLLAASATTETSDNTKARHPERSRRIPMTSHCRRQREEFSLAQQDNAITPTYDDLMEQA